VAVVEGQAGVLDGDGPHRAVRHSGGRLPETQMVPSVLAAQPRLCILWKPPGWTVSVTSSEDDVDSSEFSVEEFESGKPMQTWVMQRFGADHPITKDSNTGHGLVHRLDKQTSGPLLWARNYAGFHAARLWFTAHRVRKEYACLCTGWMPLEPRSLWARLQKVRTEHGARSIVTQHGRPAHTDVVHVGHLLSADGRRISLVRIRLHTGRMHQIRAHLSNDGHPILGDLAYGGDNPPWCPRVCLHSCFLQLDIGDGPIGAFVAFPADLKCILAMLEPMDTRSGMIQGGSPGRTASPPECPE